MVNDVEFKFEVPGCGHEFRVESFHVHEELSKPFHINLSLLSLDPDISFDELIRKAGTLTLYGQGVGAARVFNGVVNEVRYLGTGRRFSRYQLVLVPQAWFLSQRQDCRIFQQKSAQDIITEVLDDGAVTDYRFEVSGTYPPKEYVLQYRESDLHFVQRMMAEHGMWYYFDHSDSNHTMVIVDSNDSIAPLISSPLNASYIGPIVYHADGGGVADREHISDLELVNRVRTGQVTYTDYNYEHPKIPQEMTQAGELDQDLKQFDYPGRYVDPLMGQVRTTEWMSEHIVDNQQVEATSDVMRLASGYSFNVSDHPRSEINRDYLMLSVMHTGQDPQVHEDEASGMPTTYYNQFSCIPRDVVFKAPKLAAPVVDGPQTAVVVGPEGEEIYTDKLGRVKVQFHWDRYGDNNEHSSCWIRVSQSMAAPTWGAVYLPRIGHEVVVTFLEGDPDRPLVTGAVYNGLHFPPYSLPENKTRTTFRTQTHKGTGYNELSFEDEANQEEVYIHAQKDMSTKVLNNRYRDIGQDEFLKVARHQTNEVHGDHKETIHGHKTTQVNSTFTETVEQDVTVTYNANEAQYVKNNSDLEIGDNRTTKIGKNDDLDIGENSNLTIGASKSSDIGADDNQTVGGNLTVSVKGNTAYKADGATQIISGDKIVLKTGGSSLVMNSDGSIKLSGSAITIEGSDKVVVKGGNVVVN
ncbi:MULTISPECIES: type VI secretion system Vgr family protein [Vibrio]|uniref:type VI secretion system Vgr family protein n=1 Tax=Vibrio TaxID=662 RepID=UPI0012AE066B|nr:MULTISPECIES: type VI secretion system tip protein VgrG [Vibrio]EGQ8038931.1 type VI secretion system tip protein VgrG [Vibrio alginolyticus]EGQ8982462.1 type VI secretion system tip protein VgrG [Vibrio alginolyticus]EID0030755.1 type VI secretion system tip protein VgrG [Vibrio alginolyticus]EJN8557628.1 type VI secretion system tip protein VgrG [Vibrio alginolyticus]ELA6779691.1 type VI secretion system tip protein VgrG [Vibrio alginolyticus]